MSRKLTVTNLLAGLQWLFFMFANTVVIPLTIGDAFHLPPEEAAGALQRSFIWTGVACILQVIWGHKYPLMEGQSGLWWGAILSLSASTSASGMNIRELGGGLAIGIIASGILIMVLGAIGISQLLERLFTPIVMSTVRFLLAANLIEIFTKGMLGLTTGNRINIPVAGLSIFLIVLTAWINIKGPGMLKNFSILIGIVTGWILYALLFPVVPADHEPLPKLIDIFPWGQPIFHTGLIIMAVVTGFINTTNTMAAIKGVEPLLKTKTTRTQYRHSFMLTGLNSILSGLLGMVPYAPYISSLGFLRSTRIYERVPMIIGAAMFIMLGLVPPLSQMFSALPISVGDAVLFVAYLQLFSGALSNLEGIHFTSVTIYRIAAPVLLGLALMNIPAWMFASLPILVRPLVSNGMIIGILLVIFLEKTIDWSKLEKDAEKEVR